MELTMTLGDLLLGIMVLMLMEAVALNMLWNKD